MNNPTPIDLPDGFPAVRAHILDHVWRDEFTVSEIPAPHRIAPDAMALDATVCEGDRTLGQGRLIILHDPEAPEAWQGTTRLVTVARAEVDLEMATDPLLSGVARSWLTDALDNLKAPYTCLAGTATSVVSRSFGGLDDKPQESRIELRASWTPLVDDATQLDAHLAAWQDLLCHICGLPPADPGVVMLRRHRRWEADA
ncbi:DUF3000 domain-containing protein [Acidipropionibacterium jensenii]|uniref:DUF3000 domain-containing protein n=1 Tax=Acidipropionibacterium jensenii TaxID=1749 RepID=A0A3S4V584_9ACTN|nr:DUF3000 domain-containing protein [Acidipropionibacterium jensenii]MDN6557203.1 DUF3000 domain-containing protein [Acidipropionibacterium acidipropionici]AZZ39535.1 DUF3000 domain-containing protein [Acidipropionibacterium jensenii]MDN5976194.1 DUF3000 domain-containing protein [Acidipropionibacterium jensenii]MDN5995320.1 DUF3000 domain-containing protein [Acidipropionibacterium jensenii]MDN6427784.1 DUF3000 domain-containing protein [Acidipropionibacterium jensenii]